MLEKVLPSEMFCLTRLAAKGQSAKRKRDANEDECPGRSGVNVNMRIRIVCGRTNIGCIIRIIMDEACDEAEM